MYEARRRRPLRMPSYDYASSGAYFVTICVRERACLFGEVADGLMCPNDTGELVVNIWRELPERFPTVTLDAFVVMPNHVHGILWLADNPVGVGLASPDAGLAPLNDAGRDVGEGRGTGDGREAGGASPTPTRTSSVRPKRPSLGSVVGAFKSLTTVRANRLRDTPGQPLWQRDYYERVVRNDGELYRFRRYIAENPARWPRDPENPMIQRSRPPSR